MPTTAPVERPLEATCTCGAEDAVPDGLDEVVVVVDVGAAEDELKLELGVAERNFCRNPVLPLSLAGRRSDLGHEPCAHGFDAQHPRKGGVLKAHVYQSPMLPALSQSCVGRMLYVSGLKVVGRRFS